MLREKVPDLYPDCERHVLDSMVHMGVINISVSAGTIERQVVKM